MAGYSQKDANRALRERKDTKPQSNTCGSCGDDCNGLLCESCKTDISATGQAAGDWSRQ